MLRSTSARLCRTTCHTPCLNERRLRTRKPPLTLCMLERRLRVEYRRPRRAARGHLRSLAGALPPTFEGRLLTDTGPSGPKHARQVIVRTFVRSADCVALADCGTHCLDEKLIAPRTGRLPEHRGAGMASGTCHAAIRPRSYCLDGKQEPLLI